MKYTKFTEVVQQTARACELNTLIYLFQKGKMYVLIGFIITGVTIVFPYEWVGNIDRVGFREPSGIVYHPTRNLLYVVGDEGDILVMRKDGEYVIEKHLADADLEGITVNPSTGLLYIAVEGDEKILEVDPDSLVILREFVIDRYFQGKELLMRGGQGIEGITFIPDDEHPEGGTFLVSNQSFNLEGGEPSVICELEVPIVSSKSVLDSAKIVRIIYPGIIDVSGLYYNPLSNTLFVISDATNVFLEMSLDGQILKQYAFIGDDQEGITLDDEGYLYIAQDSGGIIKVRYLGD